MPEDFGMLNSRRVRVSQGGIAAGEPQGDVEPDLPGLVHSQSLWSTPQFQLQVDTNTQARADSANLRTQTTIEGTGVRGGQRLAAG
jgi:hypothetical protein